jgi:hypothetical protein
MAAPITHIVLTAKVFDKYFLDKNKKDFFVGTCFPDIRNLKVIERDKTHFTGLTLADLKTDISFAVGLKFHSILDIAREKFIVDNKAYSFCPESKYITHSIKYLEDEYFYGKINNWSEYIGYLDEILPEEIAIGIAEKDIGRWHILQAEYFKIKPDNKILSEYMRNINFSDEAIDEILDNLEIMRGDKRIEDVLERLYDDFEKIIM